MYGFHLSCFVYGVDVPKSTLHYAPNPEWKQNTNHTIENIY